MTSSIQAAERSESGNFSCYKVEQDFKVVSRDGHGEMLEWRTYPKSLEVTEDTHFKTSRLFFFGVENFSVDFSSFSLTTNQQSSFSVELKKL